MWTAAAGAAVQAQNLDLISNNLANSDTTAFKKDIPAFKEYLATAEREPYSADIPHGPIKDKDFYNLDGRDQSHVIMDGTHTSFQQGHLRVTQGQFDVALDGPGFLEVNTPQGIRYTRQGTLKVNQDGLVVTAEGYPVLLDQPLGLAGEMSNSPLNDLTPGASAFGRAAQDPAARYISVRDLGSQFSITDQGEIYAGNEKVGKLAVVEFRNLKRVKKSGGQLFENMDVSNKMLPLKTQVRQGVVETSNVNPIEEMTNMIKANRLFEQDLKSLKTYGELLGKEANEVGKL
jgi:flagellar basal-body rod protein FlgF